MAIVVIVQGVSLKETRQALANLRSPLSGRTALTSKRTMACPLPGTARPTDDLSPSLSEPYPLESDVKDFSITLAHSRTMCNQFRVTVTRTDPTICHKAADTAVSRDPATQEFITKKLGPDTIQVRVDGAERYMMDTPTEYSIENCSYSYDFRLNAPGAVWLSVMQIFEDYQGYYELAPNTTIPLKMSYNFLTLVPVQLDLCGGACPDYEPKLRGKPAKVFRPESVTNETAVNTASFPACGGDDPVPGTYVRSAHPSTLYPTDPLAKNGHGRQAGALYDFIPSECTWQHDGLKYRDHSSCLEKEHKALILGDSHGRAVWDMLDLRLHGNNSILATSSKAAQKSVQMGGLLLDFIWDPFVRSPHDCNYINQFDTIIVSTGSHQAAWECDTTPTSEMVVQAERIFGKEWTERCAATSYKKPKFIYLNAPAFWYPYFSYRMDCRTPHRMEDWNNKMSKIAREHGWAVIDVHSLTQPFAIDLPGLDGIHYFKTDAIDPIGDEVLDKLGICGNRAQPYTVNFLP
ncbi:hypothetical protein MNV49_000569 [Pseudohyphozyma bogoriensis]|nr:hypothetical protein MNV49_000569 [Pseudohyphozyma bogoriensis]